VGIVASQENNHHEFRSGQDNGPKSVLSRKKRERDGGKAMTEYEAQAGTSREKTAR